MKKIIQIIKSAFSSIDESAPVMPDAYEDYAIYFGS